ncbi:lysoplasmalogenase [Cupriavidus agavae]|uniref:Putative membrane protein YhhN n=1 Tax=Cupriavidus agavae TaxID=1001822 RepID=A0A4Q7RWP7_9BURK|nr:lysoplasmalogenase [Cupriavidus agavae]RZT38354.1 putative membrane protein YhhN [Cupriavidus agavae]
MSWIAMRMPPRVREWWVAGALAGITYGVLLFQVWLEVPAGTPLTGQIAYQPLWKAAMALLLARAAWFHQPRVERRWLVTALLFSALGDLLLALPGLRISFVGGLAAFLMAHLAYLRLFVPLGADLRASRLVGCGIVLGAAGALLGRFWPNLGALVWPVTGYIGVLAAMACAALLARLPTPWAAIGALCFVVSDALIGTARFLSPFETYQLAIWWTYAIAQVLLVAGLVAGREA